MVPSKFRWLISWKLLRVYPFFSLGGCLKGSRLSELAFSVVYLGFLKCTFTRHIQKGKSNWFMLRTKSEVNKKINTTVFFLFFFFFLPSALCETLTWKWDYVELLIVLLFCKLRLLLWIDFAEAAFLVVYCPHLPSPHTFCHFVRRL